MKTTCRENKRLINATKVKKMDVCAILGIESAVLREWLPALEKIGAIHKNGQIDLVKLCRWRLLERKNESTNIAELEMEKLRKQIEYLDGQTKKNYQDMMNEAESNQIILSKIVCFREWFANRFPLEVVQFVGKSLDQIKNIGLRLMKNAMEEFRGSLQEGNEFDAE